MALNIPVPKTFMQSFLDTRKQGVAEDLARAQAQEARGKASQANMLANLLNQSSGGAGSASTNGGGDIGRAMLLSGALHMPTQVVEGQLITPFGNYKVGESPTEKGARETSQKQTQEQGASEIKQQKELTDTYHTLRDTYGLYKDLQDLLKKNPSLTGLGPESMRRLRLSKDPDLAAFQEKAGRLQAALGRLASQRGGAAVINWASSVKPHPGNTGKYNLGLINSAMKDLEREHRNINEEHKSIGGKGFKSLSETSANADTVMMVRPDGKTVPVHSTNVDKAIKEYKFRPVE